MPLVLKPFHSSFHTFCSPCNFNLQPTLLLITSFFHRRRYEEDSENAWNCGSWFEYLLVVILSAVLLIGSLVLTIFWVIYYRGGFAWNDDPKLQFNLHPVLMVAGFITFSGFCKFSSKWLSANFYNVLTATIPIAAILMYRLCRCMKTIYVKLAHMLFHACAIPCVVIGFLAVLDYHNLSAKPIPNFYSLHSWLGFVTMGLFATQFIVGFFRLVRV